MASKTSSFFSDLTRIFRSGPTIRRKVNSVDTLIAVPDRTKSSGALLFQKSATPTYATITGNAYNLSERMSRYQDYATMEQTPELAAALNVYADECMPQDDKGKIIHVFSENEKIKDTLEDLFINVMNFEFNGRPWARNLVKYGDMFNYLDVHPDYGVINVIPIPVNEIEREEGYDRENPYAVRFRWNSLGAKVLENWEIAHFRLIGNDLFLPYGSSMIEPARRIWRQLILIEDAMLVYRVVRAPERRVFYIDVGNASPDEVEKIVQKQRDRLRSSQVIDPTTSRVDMRYNPMPLHKDTPVPLLNGTTMTIENLSSKMKENPGWTPWVHSVSDVDARPLPGKVVWCGKNYAANKLVKVWLDDGGYVLAAPEHPFRMRDNTSKRADALKSGDALMPLYLDTSTKEKGFDIVGYPVTYDVSKEKWKFVHRLVANDALHEQREEVRRNTDWKKNNNLTVHHVNAKKHDATPENLRWMGNVDHIKYHAQFGAETIIKYNKSDAKRKKTSEDNRKYQKAQKMGQMYNGTELHKSHNEIRRAAQIKSWAENKEARTIAMKLGKCPWVVTDELMDKVYDIVKNNPKLGRAKIDETIKQDTELMKRFYSVQPEKKQDKDFYYGVYMPVLAERGFNSLEDLRASFAGYKNHKVTNVEFVDCENEDVYCLTVTGPNGEDDRHNFGVCSLKPNDEGGLSAQVAVIVNNSSDEDFIIPVRGTDTATKIDTLAGGVNTAAVEDVQYIQRKLFAALQIPPAYLGYEDGMSSKSTLSQLDIRFSRTINTIQKTIIAELNKIAIIHLYAHGFRSEDLLNFSLRLTSPSTIAEQQKLEIWRTKFEIAGSAPELFLSRDFVRKEVLNLSDKQIAQVEREIIKDAEFNKRLEAVGTDVEAPEAEEASIFGSDEPAEPETSTPEEKPEEPVTLKASDTPEEEESDVELLTSFDDLTGRDKPLPVKKPSQLGHVLYNRSRRRTHGASKTHMPDHAKMTGLGDKDDTLQNPYDTAAVLRPEGKLSAAVKPMLGIEHINMLAGLSEKIGKSFKVTSNLLKETNLDEEIDIDID
jgi:hypothetical protein